MKRIVFVSLCALCLWSTGALANDVRLFPRQKVLAELFTASWCGPCVYSNKYLDEELIPALALFNCFVLVAYRVQDYNLTSFMNRIRYYMPTSTVTPSLFLDGRREIYPLDLTADFVRLLALDSTTLFLDIQGSPLDDRGLTEVEVIVTASALVEKKEYNLFLALTQSGIDPASWSPPYYPPNGETVYNHVVRLMITGESGKAFTIQPGETLVFENEFTMDPSWNADSCEIVAFVQNLATRQVLQANSLILRDLTIKNLPPTVLTEDSLNSYCLIPGDTLAVRIMVEDPDPGDVVTLTFSTYYSTDGISYKRQLARNVTFLDSLIIFQPDNKQQGSYRFIIIGSDRHGLSDTVELNVKVTEIPLPERSCDFNGDARVNISDVVAYLLLMRRNPADPLLDWNGDGDSSLEDAVTLLLDIMNGNCPSERLALSAAMEYASRFLPLSLNQEEFEHIERMIDLMSLTADQERELIQALYGYYGHSVPPGAYSLGPNVPNPFNPSTAISYSIPAGRWVQVVLEIYDLRGHPVRTLVDEMQGAGTYKVFWDGTDGAGRRVSSGVYFYRMQAGDFIRTRKLVLLK
ncbi:MAG TPA: Omp28-related outer membrane protein [archaeon]|nr:Omp28-related outer membrane protein [archaeon]